MKILVNYIASLSVVLSPSSEFNTFFRKNVSLINVSTSISIVSLGPDRRRFDSGGT